MGWLVAVVALAVLLVAIDRMTARGWFDRRRHRERRPAESAAASGMLGDLIDVFQPNRVHLTAEQERQKLDILQTGDSAGRLDLDSGVVRLDPEPPPR
ncbi:DUF6191 domain-containing protein [Cellulomonas sp. P5_E12]